MAGEEKRAHPATGQATESVRKERDTRRPPPPPRSSKLDVLAAGSLRPGTVVADRYRIERVLGVGGMGAVYEATQLGIDRRVALKVVRADLAGDPTMAARFQREARAAAAVRHPSVVVVHEFGQHHDGTLFLVMELLSGESLSQRVKREGRLPPREAVRIVAEVAGALDVAHEAGVVHRDLKPDNVFLTSGGGVKVLDFGIARLVERSGDTPAPAGDGAALTEIGQMLGTPRYMSPEAVARMPVGPAADLYSLGCILFELLAGRHVFQEKEPVILMGHHLRTPAPRLREVAPQGAFPAALDGIVEELLKKLPVERMASAATLRQRLLSLDWAGPTLAEELARDTRFAPPPDEEVPPEAVVRGGPNLGRALRFVPLLLLAGTVAWLLSEHRARLDAARREAERGIVITTVDAGVSRAEVVPTAQIALGIAPADAPGLSIRWDGVPQPGPVFDVPVDGRPHDLAISADGYETVHLEVQADGPHDYSVSLTRARGRRRGGGDGR